MGNILAMGCSLKSYQRDRKSRVAPDAATAHHVWEHGEKIKTKPTGPIGDQQEDILIKIS